jgi:hypothetical protein
MNPKVPSICGDQENWIGSIAEDVYTVMSMRAKSNIGIENGKNQ